MYYLFLIKYNHILSKNFDVFHLLIPLNYLLNYFLNRFLLKFYKLILYLIIQIKLNHVQFDNLKLYFYYLIFNEKVMEIFPNRKNKYKNSTILHT
jgi:hypothetical protein